MSSHRSLDWAALGERRRAAGSSGSPLIDRTGDPTPPYTSSDQPSFQVAPIPASTHQISLEGVMSVDGTPGSLESTPLEPDQRDRATHIFNQIVNHCEPLQTENGPYKRITLVRVTYEYVPSRDNFLRYFFLDMERDLDFSQALSRLADFNDWDTQRKNELAPRLTAFADYLVDNFFLPCKTAFVLQTIRSPADIDL
jgi:hypothetical protein